MFSDPKSQSSFNSILELDQVSFEEYYWKNLKLDAGFAYLKLSLYFAKDKRGRFSDFVLRFTDIDVFRTTLSVFNIDFW